MFDGAFGMGCSPSILSSLSKNSNHRKDSGLYGSNISDTNSNNKIDIHNDSNTSTALANQILAQSASGKDSIEKEYMKKDSIVSVSGFGHITHNYTIIPSTIRRATIGGEFLF